jgi:hypothetical protein
MRSAIRRRFTYANVVATLVLVFAMSGGAYAATRYVITSTRQISPKVLKSLQGRSGSAGANGAPGAAGAQGPAGAAGAQGPKGETGAPGPQGDEGKEGKEGKPGEKGANGTTGFTETLPSDKTEMGIWSAVNMATVAGQEVNSPISFTIPLAAPLSDSGCEKSESPCQVHYIGVEEGEGEPHEKLPAGCSGNVGMPAAEKGNLCVFAKQANNVELTYPVHFLAPQLTGYAQFNGAGAAGTIVVFKAEKVAEEVTVSGSWAVTAE